MLPFMKQKANQTGIATTYRTPDEGSESQESGDHAMEAVAKDLIAAVNNNDFKKLAKILRDAQEIADSESHVEGEHLDEEELEG